MRFSTPALAALAASYPVADAYSLWGPTLFEPSITLSPMIRRQRAMSNRFDQATRELSPRYEIMNVDDKLQIAMDVPGVKREDIDVSLEDSGRVLTIRGHRKALADESKFISKFSQSFSLDQAIDVDGITANLKDGVLTLTAPKDMKRLEQNIRSIPITQNSNVDTNLLSASASEKGPDMIEDQKLETGHKEPSIHDLEVETSTNTKEEKQTPEGDENEKGTGSEL